MYSAGTHPDFLVVVFSTNHQPVSFFVTTFTIKPFVSEISFFSIAFLPNQSAFIVGSNAEASI